MQLFIQTLVVTVVMLECSGHRRIRGELPDGDVLIYPPSQVTDQPYFDSTMLRNQTAHVGRDAELHCRVHSIGNRTVSWIRGRDLRILTVGRYTYTTDFRNEALHLKGTNQWTLRITSVQKGDEGFYECQISTKPMKAFKTYLTVLEPRGEILGAPDLYVQRSSMINLTCVLHDLPEPPAYVIWFHTDRNGVNQSISYSGGRGGVSMIVEKGGPTSTSHLLLQEATEEDSGLYTCQPSNHPPTSVTVHVLNGEFPRAMQTNASGRLDSEAIVLCCFFFFFYYFSSAVTTKALLTPHVT